MTVSGFLATNSGVAAMNTGIRSNGEKSSSDVPSPSETAIELYGSTLTMASMVLAAIAATMSLTFIRISWKSPFFRPCFGAIVSTKMLPTEEPT